MRKKIGICGHFGNWGNFADGQTIKTKILHDELCIQLGKEEVTYMDTYNWGKNFFKLIINALWLSIYCKNIIIILSTNGRRVFIPLFYLFKLLFRNKVHCMVIGGSFPRELEKYFITRYYSRKLDGIYLETVSMADSLAAMNFKNVHVINNFKKLNILKEISITKMDAAPFKLCTFSRVLKEKGIEDIVDAVKRINHEAGRVIYTLDIYGQIDTGYEMEFNKLKGAFPNYISYKGVIAENKSVETIKNYFMLAFLTYYSSEGFPGTIIDAFSAGVPVLASDWKYNSEIIKDGYTGLIVQSRNIDDVVNKLKVAAKNSEKIYSMKKNCLNSASAYASDIVIPSFLKILEEDLVL